MKEGWHKATLGAVAQVGAGNSAPQGDALFVEGVYPFFRTSDAGRVRFGNIVESSDYLNDKGIKGLRLLPAGTILFPKSGASTFLNHRVMMAVDGYVSSHLATIVGDESKVDRRFLLYFLSTVSAQDLVQDHAYPSLNLPLISGIPILLPSLSEQQRIVAILDEAFAEIATAKANAEQNLLNARALFESYLNKVFTERGDGWQTVPFGEIAAFRNGINFTKSSRGTPIKILGVKDFQNHYWAQFEDFDSIVPEGLVPDPDTLIEGDIVFVRSNGNPDLIGRCLLIGQLPERTTHSGFTIKARLQQDSVLPAYLCHFLKLKDTRQEMIDGGNGANIKSLNQGTLSRIVVPFPSLSKQAEIVRQLEDMQVETQRLESLNQQKLAALDELKKSLLHQAFSGAL